MQSNTTALDYDRYCTRSEWRTSSESGNCTLRLALYYCIYRVPWNNLQNLSCRIYFKNNMRLDFGGDFYFGFKGKEHTTMKILIDFRFSSFFVTDSLSFVNNASTTTFKLDVKITNANFVSRNMVDVSTTSVIPTIRMHNISSVYISSTNFQHVALFVSDSQFFSASRINLRNFTSLNPANTIDVFPVSGDIENNHALELRRVGKINITNGHFENNKGYLYGGAVFIDQSDEVYISQSHFTSNSAAYGAAIALHGIKKSIIANNLFVRNIASEASALYWICKFMIAPVLSNNTFSENIAKYSPDYSSSICSSVASPTHLNVTKYISIALPRFLIRLVDAYDQEIDTNSQVCEVTSR